MSLRNVFRSPTASKGGSLVSAVSTVVLPSSKEDYTSLGMEDEALLVVESPVSTCIISSSSSDIETDEDNMFTLDDEWLVVNADHFQAIMAIILQ